MEWGTTLSVKNIEISLNKNEFTITENGLYKIYATVATTTSNAAKFIRINVTRDGTTTIYYGPAFDRQAMTVEATVPLIARDVVDIRLAGVGSGQTLSPGALSNRFSIAKVG